MKDSGLYNLIVNTLQRRHYILKKMIEDETEENKKTRYIVQLLELQTVIDSIEKVYKKYREGK
jgi:acetolactate synthase small subunit